MGLQHRVLDAPSERSRIRKLLAEAGPVRSDQPLSTNMAGRGTEYRAGRMPRGAQVGLHVIGERGRHDAQGSIGNFMAVPPVRATPAAMVTFVSLEDD